jgi:hypothetical protein
VDGSIIGIEGGGAIGSGFLALGLSLLMRLFGSTRLVVSGHHSDSRDHGHTRWADKRRSGGEWHRGNDRVARAQRMCERSERKGQHGVRGMPEAHGQHRSHYYRNFFRVGEMG